MGAGKLRASRWANLTCPEVACTSSGCHTISCLWSTPSIWGTSGRCPRGHPSPCLPSGLPRGTPDPHPSARSRPHPARHPWGLVALPWLGPAVLQAADPGKAGPDPGDGCAFSHFRFFSRSFGSFSIHVWGQISGLGGALGRFSGFQGMR